MTTDVQLPFSTWLLYVCEDVEILSSEEPQEDVRKKKTDPLREVTFGNLKSGTEHTVKLYVVVDKYAGANASASLPHTLMFKTGQACNIVVLLLSLACPLQAKAC